jgi:hypothetical protein
VKIIRRFFKELTLNNYHHPERYLIPDDDDG